MQPEGEPVEGDRWVTRADDSGEAESEHDSARLLEEGALC